MHGPTCIFWVNLTAFSLQNWPVAALNAKMAYGLLLSEADDMEAAIPLLEEVYSGHRDVLGQNDPQTLRAAMNLGNALADEPGRKAQSHEMLGAAVEGYITAFGEDHTDTLDAKMCAGCPHLHYCALFAFALCVQFSARLSINSLVVRT